MFQPQEILSRPAMTRAPKLYLWFFGGGNLLNAICLLARPPHAHGSVWFWLSALAVVSIWLGALSSAYDYLTKRRTLRPKHASIA